MDKVTVLGSGSFGTSLAQHLARQGHAVCLWARDAHTVQAIAQTRRNPRFLQAFALHHNVQPVLDLSAAVQDSDWVLCALPSHALRSTLTAAKSHFSGQTLVIGTKGIEPESLHTMDAVACDVLGAGFARQIVALSGPSFAREIMEGQPTAVVLASHDPALAQAIAPRFFCDTFRAYISDDVIGVEIGGAIKNVMAIAAGAITGMGLGDNSRAAMITRGLSEITRLAVAHGADALTMLGLAGVGDLVMTCTGALSRNRTVGQALGEGKPVAEALSSVSQVAEGVQTCRAAWHLSQRLQVDAPIVSAVYHVLHKGMPVQEAMLNLVRRAPGREL